jgi:CRISPR-associated endonuclease/helicase Cas3
LVAVNPKRVYYSPEEGLHPDRLEPSPNLDQFPRRKEATDSGERQDWWYTFETYREHLKNVMNALDRVAPEVLRACSKVDAKFNLPEGTLLKAIKVAIAAHDIGKCSSEWQGWTRRWQQLQLETYPDLLWHGLEGCFKATPQPPGVFCAHTDYHPALDKARSEAQPKRPGHSGESAAVLEKTYYERFLDWVRDDGLGGQVFCAIYGAIARHHGAYSSGETAAWKLDLGSSQEIGAVFAELVGEKLDMKQLEGLERTGVPASQPTDLMPQPTEPLAWIAYSLISRALRLADSQSFVRHPSYQERRSSEN